jgi:nitroimidazol reductase NimA-like FMN-containing flavoprotein (pyridoxamine 5'-phosphate oxidase superfamily)
MMKKFCVLQMLIAVLVFTSAYCSAAEKGGPKYLYTKATKLPPPHPTYDKELKCQECHVYNGVDAYTAATMTLKKSKTGALPREEIEKRIAEIVKGKGDYREIYVLSTAYDNKPLATVIEFVIDPKTLCFYAMSEKQTEKLFQMAANKNVSLAYVKQLEHHNYFKEPLSIQVVGTAQVLKDKDLGFDEALNIYVPTLPLKVTPELLQAIKATKIVTQITPSRIVMRDYTQKEKGMRMIQIWERGEKK